MSAEAFEAWWQQWSREQASADKNYYTAHQSAEAAWQAATEQATARERERAATNPTCPICLYSIDARNYPYIVDKGVAHHKACYENPDHFRRAHDAKACAAAIRKGERDP